MQKRLRFRALALPLGGFLSILLALASEMFSAPILVLVSLLILLLGMFLSAPGIAYLIGDIFKFFSKKRPNLLLVSGGLQKRAKTIGATCVLLFSTSILFVLVTGLGSAGAAEPSEGSSYWKPGYAWGMEDNSNNEITAELPPGTVRYSDIQLDLNHGLGRHGFVMNCSDYREASVDEFECPTATDNQTEILVPPGITPEEISGSLFVVGKSKHSNLKERYTVHQIPGLTEVIVSPDLVKEEELNSYFLIPPGEDQLTSQTELMENTVAGFNNQENISSIGFRMKSGYEKITVILSTLLAAASIGATIAIVGVTLQERKELRKSLEHRGLPLKKVRKILINESANLTFPFVLTGLAAGVVFSLAIASASSLNPTAIFSPLLGAGAILILASSLILPRVMVRFAER